jgi:hypothetical protein
MALGAYQAETSRGNVLNAIAHPNVVDPVGDMAKAYQTFNALSAARQTIANQQIGGILQQATDPDTGQVDYGQAQKLAAQAGPTVQLGMQNMLANNATQRGQQIQQGVAQNTAVSNAIIGALNGDDAGLHDRVVGGFKSLVANGVMTQDEATRSALALPNDPTQMRQRLQQIQTSLAPPDLQQQQISGHPLRRRLRTGAAWRADRHDAGRGRAAGNVDGQEQPGAAFDAGAIRRCLQQRERTRPSLRCQRSSGADRHRRRHRDRATAAPAWRHSSQPRCLYAKGR